MADKKKSKGKTQIWKLYDKSKRKNKTCPKCGAAVFMAEHKDRFSCGKCKYTEYKAK